MNRMFALPAVTGVIVLNLVAPCSPDQTAAFSASSSAHDPAPAVALHTFARDDSRGGLTSRVRVLRYGNRSETVVGDTLLRGSGRVWRIREDVELSPAGRLERASVCLEAGEVAPSLVREVRLDAACGVWSIRDASGEVSGRLPAQIPWAYASLLGDVAPELAAATPMGAWVTLRAAEANDAVLMIDSQAGVHAVASDQLLIADGARRWVVLGDEAIEADADFVREAPRQQSASSAVARQRRASTRASL